jgi:hypothetical protein
VDAVVLEQSAPTLSYRSGLVRSQVNVALSSRRVELSTSGRLPSIVKR